MNARPKIQRLVAEAAARRQGVSTLDGYSTAYCLSRTLADVLVALSDALNGGRQGGTGRGTGLLTARDACIEGAAVLLEAAEQAQRDYDSLKARSGGFSVGEGVAR
jgi:hypothetical protein